jgi:protein-disulfide isomerase
MKSSYTIPLAIVFGGAVIAVALYMSVPQKASGPDTVNPSLVRPVSASDHIFGNPAAPVVIIEYADFDCAPCRDFHDTLHYLVANEGGGREVAWVFRHFPLEVHPNALALARAAECAASTAGSDPVASNNAFWKFANALYQKQPVNPSGISGIASLAEISGGSFATCYADTPATLSDRIAADQKNALDMGALGAPFSVILTKGENPVVVEAAYPYEMMQQVVAEALGS